MKVEVSSIPLTLRHTFRIAREASDKRKNVLLKLTDEDGICGLGEAAPSVYYNQTAESVQERLRGMSESDFVEPFLREKILERAEGILGEQRSALAAVDMALYRLVGKASGRSSLSPFRSQSGGDSANLVHDRAGRRRGALRKTRRGQGLSCFEVEAWDRERQGDRLSSSRRYFRSDMGRCQCRLGFRGGTGKSKMARGRRRRVGGTAAPGSRSGRLEAAHRFEFASDHCR